jgi:serine/threonine protein kinase
MLHTTCGTPNYVAPEVLEDKGYDGRKADIWSCGVILYVLLAGFLPFDERTMPELFAKIQSADVSYPAFFCGDVKDLLARILTNDPVARISMEEILKHEWFTKGGTLTNVRSPRGEADVVHERVHGYVNVSDTHPPFSTRVVSRQGSDAVNNSGLAPRCSRW